jgi:hypothetical protein
VAHAYVGPIFRGVQRETLARARGQARVAELARTRVVRKVVRETGDVFALLFFPVFPELRTVAMIFGSAEYGVRCQKHCLFENQTR